MPSGTDQFQIADIPGRVRRAIYDHVLPHLDHEVGGVLVGRVDGRTGQPRVSGAIAALEAIGERASVTFTQEAWATILELQEAEYPNTQIVGWYHSHPGFGIFLSEHDLFIHRNFFGDAHQFAYVVDPVERSEGVFGWQAGELALLDQGLLDGSVGGLATTGPVAVTAEPRASKLTVELDDLEEALATPAAAADPVVESGGGFAIAAADLDAVPAPPPTSPRPLAGSPLPGSAAAIRAAQAEHAARRRRTRLAAGTAGVVGVAAVVAVGLGMSGGSSAGPGTPPDQTLLGRQIKHAETAQTDAEGAIGDAQRSTVYIAPTPTPTPVPKAVTRTPAPQAPGNPVPNNVPPAAPSKPHPSDPGPQGI